MTLPEGTDNIHHDSIVAPACELCNCTVDEASRRYYVEGGGAPEGEWPGSHTECVENAMCEERTGSGIRNWSIPYYDEAMSDMLDATIRGL